jgi:CRP-like cAMP-binding protein
MNTVKNDFIATPFGATLNADEVSVLMAVAKERHIKEGQYLCRSGDSGESLYIVLHGALQVFFMLHGEQETPIARIAAGQVVGELEFLTRSLRVASLKALEDSQVLEFPATSINKLLDDNQAAANKLIRLLAQTVARRMVMTNQHLIGKLQAQEPPKPPVPPSKTAKNKETFHEELKDDELAMLDKIWS